MADDVHEVVKLLVKRMESHPEEFSDADVIDEYSRTSTNDRWWKARTMVQDFGNEADREALVAGMREIKLKAAHEWAMDELLNGPDRRRKQEEERELEKQRILQQARNTTQMDAQRYAMQQAAQKYGSQYNYQAGALTSGLRGKSFSSAIMDEYANAALGSVASGNALQLGNEKLDESLLKRLKGLLK